MAAHKIRSDQKETAIEAVKKYGNVSAAARALGIPDRTLRRWFKRSAMDDVEVVPPPEDFTVKLKDEVVASTHAKTVGPEKILAALKKPRTLEEAAALVGASPGYVLDRIIELRNAGKNIHELGGRYSLEAVPVAEEGRSFTYTSDKDHTFRFGISSDQHLGSKYERLDVLERLYDEFAAEGVTRVFNAGNWIDGEDQKNQFDLLVHGLEPQVNYLVDRYPQRDGITTYAIWGEDHEGWFARRESIDMGRFAEAKMLSAGRHDWRDLGFIEAKIDLINADTGMSAPMVVMHPGGGSSYAYSYRPQKIVESLQGGEKPGVLIIGHYHKMSVNLIRNVWTIQAGCSQDQTVFMRKHGLDAHVGGFIVELKQDPETGAIRRCKTDQITFFNRRYQNDRWSKTDRVVHPEKIENW